MVIPPDSCCMCVCVYIYIYTHTHIQQESGGITIEAAFFVHCSFKNILLKGYSFPTWSKTFGF